MPLVPKGEAGAHGAGGGDGLGVSSIFVHKCLCCNCSNNSNLRVYSVVFLLGIVWSKIYHHALRNSSN